MPHFRSAVRLGDTPTWSAAAAAQPGNRSAIVRIDVDTVYQHQTRDIALIRLAEPVRLQPGRIEPICLPPSNSYNYRELEQHKCVREQPAQQQQHRRRTRKPQQQQHVVSAVDVQLVQPHDCAIMFRRKEARFTNAEFCAWDEPGDTCTGDLGGPLTALWNDRRYVIGLSSYIHVGSDVDFVPADYPGVYTRVGAHLEWIRAVMGAAEAVAAEGD